MKMLCIPTKRERSRLCECAGYTYVYRRGYTGLIFSGYPEATGFITVSLITNRKTFDLPRASLPNYWVTAN